MADTIILYESPELDWLGPPVSTRPVWDLRLGPFTPEILLRRALPDAEVCFWAREQMQGFRSRAAETVFKNSNVILVDARLLPLSNDLPEALADLKSGETLSAETCDFARKLSGVEAQEYLTSLSKEVVIPQVSHQSLKTDFGPLLRFWWEMPQLAADLLHSRWGEALEITGAQKAGEGELYLSPGSKLQPDVAIAGGPVMLDRDAEVAAQAYLGGPCYLGPGTKVRPQARLLHGVFAGPQCRLGGEIEETVFLGYANKQHDGFLGHAIIGEWVNLGAGTNNSDLKNNYNSVRVSWRGRDFNTGQQFLGSCLGDHAKVAIGGRLNTGTVMGSFCNWFGGGFAPKVLPDFSWADDSGIARYDLEKALGTARKVMARRNRDLDASMEAVYRDLAAARG
jgi:UDP-N-acetylglucosamine diphosphorylase/glucosamine-1-phosphate N-acetyltransferase